MLRLSPVQQKVFLVLAVVGFVGPNGVFLYYAFADYAVVAAAQSNPVAAAFIGEALFLMVLLAWLLHRQLPDTKRWLEFVGASLLGSLAFSVPLFAYLLSRAPASADDRAT